LTEATLWPCVNRGLFFFIQVTNAVVPDPSNVLKPLVIEALFSYARLWEFKIKCSESWKRICTLTAMILF
jgi:hypothetical protein